MQNNKILKDKHIITIDEGSDNNKDIWDLCCKRIALFSILLIIIFILYFLIDIDSL
tara:strand:- start:392 stop:559 length:168 start_codon:yes stop_codon:yes gene_type:complete